MTKTGMGRFAPEELLRDLLSGGGSEGVSARLLLVRHAHREKNWGQEADNGLSDRGRAEVDLWVRAARACQSADRAIRALTSPKVRCVETLEPWAAELGLRLEVDPRLDEQGAAREVDFVATVSAFLKEARAGRLGSRVIVCSHGDWIPLFLELAGERLRVDLATGTGLLLDLRPQ